MTARIIPFPAPMAEWVEYDAAEAAALERIAKEAADRAMSEAIMADYHDRREQPAPMADLRDGGNMPRPNPWGLGGFLWGAVHIAGWIYVIGLLAHAIYRAYHGF